MEIAQHRTDFRKRFDGLLGEASVPLP